MSENLIIDKDQSYLIALIKGDRKAFEYFFSKYYALLVLFSFKIIKRKEVSEDIVQDVFVTLWKIKETLSKLLKIKPYLYTSTKNKSLNHLKLQKNTVVSASSEDDYYDDENSYLEEKQEQINKVNKAIEALPEKCKEVFILVKKEGYSYKETAEHLNISVKTVEAQVSKAIKLIKNEFLIC